MAVRTRDELLEAIRNRIGEDSSDEALALIEDVTDTLDDYDSRSNEDWESRYHELDSSWRQRYRDRFFANIAEEHDKDIAEQFIEQDSATPKTFDDLFTTTE